MVDNGSTDQSIAVLQGYPEVRVIRLEKNHFFSGAVNTGIREAKGEIIVLLNNDTEAEPQWLEELVGAFGEDERIGMTASKMLLFDRRDIINSAGDFYSVDGIPGNRGIWEEDRGQYDAQREAFGPCGGAAAYRRRMLEEIGLFDEDFVAYCEDVDLSFRAQWAGYRCLFAPQARVYHRLSATGGGPLASYFCGRNFINVIVKNMPGALIRKYWLRIIVGQLRFTWEALRHFRESAARARIMGQGAALLELPKMLGKRRAATALHRVGDEYIESILQH